MRNCNHGRLRQQIGFLRRQFLQDGGLPFTDVLSAKTVEQALTAVGVVWNDTIYTPLVTLRSPSGSDAGNLKSNPRSPRTLPPRTKKT